MVWIHACHSSTLRFLQGRGTPEAGALVPSNQPGKPAIVLGISHFVRNDGLERSETLRSLQGRGIPEAGAFVLSNQPGKPAIASGISHSLCSAQGFVRNDSLVRCRIYEIPE